MYWKTCINDIVSSESVNYRKLCQVYYEIEVKT